MDTTGSSLDERRRRTQAQKMRRQAQEERRKSQLARKRADKKQHEENVDALVAQLTRPGMSLTDEGASYARRMKQEADDSELAALFGKAMTGVRTAGTKKPKGKGKAKQRTPVKSRGYTADRSVIQSGQLDEVVRGMGSGALKGSRDIATERTATGRASQFDRRRGPMEMGMPRRKSRKSRRKSRKSRRKSRKSRRKSRKSRRKASRKKSRRKSKSRRKASRKKSKRRKSRRKSKSRRKASRKKSRRKSRRKVYG